MRKYLFFILISMLLSCSSLWAQQLSFQFKDVSLAEALAAIDKACDSTTVSFAFDELENIRITAEVNGMSAVDAVKQICVGCPVLVTAFPHDIFIEHSQRDSVRWVLCVTDSLGRPLRHCQVQLLHPDSKMPISSGVTSDDGIVVLPSPLHCVSLRACLEGYNTLETEVVVGETSHLMLSPNDAACLKLPNGDGTPGRMMDARSYKSLWKEAWKKAEADLPRSQMAVLERIMRKAAADDNGGQLLAAELVRAAVLKTIAPDSVAAAVNQMERHAAVAQKEHPLLAAAYHTLLSSLLATQTDRTADAETYRHRAVEEVALLAQSKADWLMPLLKKGTDSGIFSDDMLSVVGMATEQYQLLYDYYSAQGNREAQMVMAALLCKGSDRYLERLDSLIDCYADLPMCCDLAIERYKLMSGDDDASVAERYAYLQQTMKRWPQWRNAPALKAMAAQLTQPEMRVDFNGCCLLPNRPHTIRFSGVRNVRRVSVGLSQVQASADVIAQTERLDMDKWLGKYGHTVGNRVQLCRHTFATHEPYELFSDSLVLNGLSPGVYIMDIVAEEAEMDTIREMIHVSAVQVIFEEFADRRARCVVVDAFSGHPLPKAKVAFYDYKVRRLATLTANGKGEVVTPKRVFRKTSFIGASAMGDNYAPVAPFRNYDYSRGWLPSSDMIYIYTDRRIYRPGQTCRLAVVASVNKKNREFEPMENTRLRVRMMDAAYQEILDTTVVTDSFGTAALSHVLPTTHGSGSFQIEVFKEKNRRNSRTRHIIQVEEYKRPSFEVLFLPFSADSVRQDTLYLPLQVKAFSGANMEGARVVAEMMVSEHWKRESHRLPDTLFTDAQGRCSLKIPLPAMNDAEGLSNIRQVEVNATVTDRGGESHEQTVEFSLSPKKYTLTVSLPDDVHRVDHEIMASVSLCDRLLKQVDDEVTYFIDRPESSFRVKANTPFALPRCPALSLAGEHRLFAVYRGDTASVSFCVTDFQAERPAVFTPFCFALSSDYFPADGGGVQLQVGSSLQDVYVVYDILSDNKVVESGSFLLDDSMYNRTLTYKPEYGAALALSFAFIKEGTLYEESASVQMPLPEKNLRMEWTSFRDRLQPGQQEEWRLRVCLPDGKPAKAQLMASLYDASLSKILPYTWQFSPFLPSFITRASWSKAECFSRTHSVSEVLDVDAQSIMRPLSFSRFNEQLLSLKTDRYTCYALMQNDSDWALLGKAKPGFVSGVVVDDSGEPVIGASVILKSGEGKHGSKGKTISDLDGCFQLPAVAAGELYVFYIGMKAVPVKAYPGRFYKIVLHDDLSALEEVVVVGYGVAKKDKADNEVAAALESIVPGVSVENESDDEYSSSQVEFAPPVVKKDEVVSSGRQTGMETVDMGDVPLMRENFNETAFFFPDLMTDSLGTVSLNFTLPDCVTTWNLECLAHDRMVNYGLLHERVVAQKQVMVQPNVPRFLREGDVADLTMRVANLGDSARTGVARLQLIDAVTDVTVATDTSSFVVGAAAAVPVSFRCTLPEGHQLLVCRYSVGGQGFSDGEQHYLPVLPARERVTDTYAFTLHGPDTMRIDVKSLLPEGSRHPDLTLEYTARPAWLLVGALPSLAEQTDEDALSQAVAFYANSVAGQIAAANPDLKQLTERWNSQENARPLVSALERNDDMKEVLLSESPWVMDAADETAQGRSIARLFDTPSLQRRLQNSWNRLAVLQHHDGGWPWFKGMPSSRCVTTGVMLLLARLHDMGCGSEMSRSSLQRAVRFLDKDAIREVKWLKESAGWDAPSELALNYLYICALCGDVAQTGDEARAAREFLLSYLKERRLSLTIYGKSVAAVVMALNGEEALAREYLKSACEYAVQSEEAGLYYDTPKAYYSWADYRIPTQVMVMEALRRLEPADTLSMQLMKRWLLHEKRTQAWNTPLNSVNAIHAFLAGGADENLKTEGDLLPTVRADGEVLRLPEAAPGMGYVRMALARPEALQNLSVGKTSGGTSWGALYARAERPLTLVGETATGISVQRELLRDGKVLPENTPLHVGDKVMVRIRIKADRDYDFVQVSDKRAACLEPVVQTSGYAGGYFSSKKDCSTVYFFDRMAKGEHVVVTEYFVDRVGSYQWGSCTAQCAYAPEFSGRTAAHQPITVLP